MNYNSTIQKLQYAINQQDVFHVLYNVNQFYSPQQHRPINMYVAKIAEWDEEKGKNKYTEVFKTAQQLHMVLFLRNLYYSLQGQKIEPEGDNIPNFEKFNSKWKEFAEEYL